MKNYGYQPDPGQTYIGLDDADFYYYDRTGKTFKLRLEPIEGSVINTAKDGKFSPGKLLIKPRNLKKANTIVRFGEEACIEYFGEEVFHNDVHWSEKWSLVKNTKWIKNLFKISNK